MSMKTLAARRLIPVAIASALLANQSAHALDILGLYLGGGVTRGEIKADVPDSSLFTGFSFNEQDTGWKAIVGIRPVSLFGAELEYMDFGSTSRSVAGQEFKGDLTAQAAFALLYLPLPVPFLDIYGKGGYGRVNGEVSGPGVNVDLDEDGWAVGGGAQLKFGSWAIRAEYEKFMLSGPDPGLASVSLTKTFL